MSYLVDIRDVKFQVFDWLPTARLLESARFEQWDRDSMEMVLDEALKIAQQQMAPCNVEGDRVGAQWHDGKVTMPPSFKAAYATVAEGGWIGMTGRPEAGGMGLPDVIGTAVVEFLFGANVSLGTSVTLARGAGAMIEQFADDGQKALYLDKLYTGEWAGTMCLTEPQAGSDVGAVKTKAVRQDDGTYRVTGEKIFITSGEHDLTENIIHLVLARTPGAAAGTRGLSLFIIPKIWVNEDGTLGEPNDVYCSNIEEKMGIHGSPTCSLVFGSNDGCRGLLLGEEQTGMKQMFLMMNGARIDVGLQGAAIAGAAYQQALAYARERQQGRHWTAMRDPEAAPVAIIEHPDVRRMLMGAKAYSEAMRALLLQAACYMDLAHVSDGDERERYQSYAEVLTPVCKAWASEWGVLVSRWCLHVLGGYGYTAEFPLEQYVRDAEIATIYEGTNGIQALDFVARKLPLRGGAAVGELLAAAAAIAGELGDDPRLGPSAALVGPALREIEATLGALRERRDGIELSLLNAVPILEMFGAVFGARFLLEQANVARARLAAILGDAGVDADDRAAYRKLLADDADAAFYHDKIASAVHFAHRALPTVAAQAVAIRAGERAPLDAVL